MTNYSKRLCGAPGLQAVPMASPAGGNRSSSTRLIWGRVGLTVCSALHCSSALAGARVNDGRNPTASNKGGRPPVDQAQPARLTAGIATAQHRNARLPARSTRSPSTGPAPTRPALRSWSLSHPGLCWSVP